MLDDRTDDEHPGHQPLANDVGLYVQSPRHRRLVTGRSTWIAACNWTVKRKIAVQPFGEPHRAVRELCAEQVNEARTSPGRSYCRACRDTSSELEWRLRRAGFCRVPRAMYFRQHSDTL